ncbi:MAG: acetate--CoA ligase family protein [Candidatus Roizmanbacteria bacterium]
MDLKYLFYPQSVAVIGASTKIGSVGNDIVKNLVSSGFKGKIYPVNPNADKLYDLPCYKDIKSVPHKVDMIVVAVPAKLVTSVLEDAGKKGVKSAVIISSGFKEIGGEGLEMEIEVTKICKKYHIATIGPNCLGLMNPEIHLNASFAAQMPHPGEIAFISQSGALCSAFLDYGAGLGVGFSKFMSIGNKASITEQEILEYLAQDEKTKVIMMYVEQLDNPIEFINTVSKITHGANPKPIIAIKSGRTSAGMEASASHTGSLGGDDAVYEALFRQSGMIRANSISELFDYASVFANNPLPKGKRVAIVTNAGGPGIITTDEVIAQGLELATLNEKTYTILRELLPPIVHVGNPVDVLGDAKAERYRIAIDAVLEDSNIDAVIVILTPQTMTEIEDTARVVIQARAKTQKPIIASFMGLITVQPGVKLLQSAHVASATFPEHAVNALARYWDYAKSVSEGKEPWYKTFTDVDRVKVKSIILEQKGKKEWYVPEPKAKEMLASYGLPFLRSEFVSKAEEAENFVKKINAPCVYKIVSPDIIHKSDVGGVLLNVTPEKAIEGYELILKRVKFNCPDAKIEGVLCVEMAQPDGFEFIIGAKRDKNMGPSIMIGLGGIYVEVFKDVVFGIPPITQGVAEKMILEIKSSRLLEGVRGKPQLDTEVFIDALMRLSQFLEEFPEVVELDMNPVLVLPKGQGIRVLDARIVLDES